jgi:hypothetical protein
MNVILGERHIFATFGVQKFIEAGIPVGFVWYDIACKWNGSWQQWLRHQEGDKALIGSGVRSPLPPLHVNMHS